MKSDLEPFCCHCGEEFPVAEREQRTQAIRMGLLYHKNRFGKAFQAGLFETSDYLCGNCWFDLTDD